MSSCAQRVLVADHWWILIVARHWMRACNDGANFGCGIGIATVVWQAVSNQQRLLLHGHRGYARCCYCLSTASCHEGVVCLKHCCTVLPAVDAAPCQQHLAAVSEAQRAALLVYDAAEVMVELIGQDELPTAFAAAGGEEP